MLQLAHDSPPTYKGETMQNAKDTFYEVLRARLAAINPERTVVLRGVVRPGVLVEENELLTATVQPDCFRLRWTETAIDANGALPLVTLACSIDYETAGTAINGGMDRGRLLAAMDAELAAMLDKQPRNMPKTNYAGLAFGNAAVAMQTSLWWGPVSFSATVTKDNRLARTATVSVMSYQEAGE
jgi:hypothetical protein